MRGGALLDNTAYCTHARAHAAYYGAPRVPRVRALGARWKRRAAVGGLGAAGSGSGSGAGSGSGGGLGLGLGGRLGLGLGGASMGAFKPSGAAGEGRGRG